MTRIPRIRRSSLAACAIGGLFVASGTRKMKADWIAKHRPFLGRITGPSVDCERVFVPVLATKNPYRIGLMDAITGSVYNPRTGRCYSSDWLRLESATETPKAAKRLMAMRAEVVPG